MSKQSFDVFFNFDGNCKEAMEFYARVFRSEVQDAMTYGDTPPSEGFEVSEADKNRVMYANVPIFGCNVMFSDTPSGSPYVQGNNVCPTLGSPDKEEITRLFAALKEGGEVYMDLAPTFFSKLFAMVQDKYGIIWQLSYTGE